MITETANCLPVVEIETRPCPTYTIVWLHGLGADGNDFVPIANGLELLPETSIRFVFPHAPQRLISINNVIITS